MGHSGSGLKRPIDPLDDIVKSRIGLRIVMDDN